MKVYVYYNLHKHRWSVRRCNTRRVIGHCDLCALSGVSFKVSEAGRERVRRERKKNVHAGVEGDFRGWNRCHGGLPREFTQVVYDPYKYETFVNASDGVRVNRSEYVMMMNGKVFALNPYWQTT